ncbi:MAG: PEP-CTERM sorting domain-containing protein [Vitreoscilla sp.]
MAALILMPAVLCAPASALADATYEFRLSGEAEQPGTSWAWTGTLEIVLDTAADGLYDNIHILAFDMNSTVSTFDWPDGGPIPFFVYVNVAGGRMTSVSGRYYGVPDPDETLDFTGLSVHYYHPVIFKTPETVGDAILIPLAVPEPGAWQMWLLGLGLAAASGAVAKKPRAGRPRGAW